MTYAWFTRRSGTPFTLNGPVTSSRPLGSCFRNTTRRPLNRPASRISTCHTVRRGESACSCQQRCLRAIRAEGDRLSCSVVLPLKHCSLAVHAADHGSGPPTATHTRSQTLEAEAMKAAERKPLSQDRDVCD